jgi:hypothetical protein
MDSGPMMAPFLYGRGALDIVVVERGGAWYVDPARSIIDTLLGNVEAMSPEQAEGMIESWAVLFSMDEDAWYASMDAESYEGCPDVDPPDDDASYEERKAAGLECSEQTNEDFDEGYEDEGYDDDGSEYEPTPSEECWSAEDDAAIEACLLALGDMDGVAEVHEMACYDSGDDAAVEACLQDLADKGEIDAYSVASFRCDAVYEEVSGGADENYDAADAAYDRCMTDAGFGQDSEDDWDDDSGTPSASTVPAPTTTTG